METNANVNILKSERIIIEKNVIEMDDSIIQISNVSSVSLRFPPKYTNSNAVIIGLVLGVLLIFSQQTALTFIGLVIAALCGYMVYRVWDKNQNLGKNIIIGTDSGGYFWINSRDDSFSLQVIDVIKNLMNDKVDNSNILINLDKLNILNNGNLVYGNVQNSTFNKDSGNYENINNSIIGNDNSVRNVEIDDIPELKI